MNTPLETKRSTWLWQVTLLSVVLGMLLAAALKTQRSIRVQWGIPLTRLPGVSQALIEQRQLNETLIEEKAELERKLSEYQQAAGEGDPASRMLLEDLKRARFMAGLTPVSGKGIEVVLQDSKRRPPADADPDLVSQYLIHDSDIRDFVNELLAAGAEAISVNDQRIIAKSAIRCVGNSIKVNDVTVGPVYTIRAIGDPELLESGLKMPHGIVEMFRLVDGVDDMVRIRKLEHITIPAYTGSTTFQYARPAETEAKQ